MKKVDALAEDIRAINPEAAVVAVRGKIESITDHDFQVLAWCSLRGGCRNGSIPNAFGLSMLAQPSQPIGVLLLVLTDTGIG